MKIRSIVTRGAKRAAKRDTKRHVRNINEFNDFVLVSHPVIRKGKIFDQENCVLKQHY